MEFHFLWSKVEAGLILFVVIINIVGQIAIGNKRTYALLDAGGLKTPPIW